MRILRGRGSATSRRIPLLYLIAAVLIVVGLSVSVPPSCVCAPDDHFGMLLHPLFPHVHGDAHEIELREDIFHNDEDDSSVRTVDQAPGISAGASDSGLHDVVTGLLLPLFLSAALLEFGRRLTHVDLSPAQQFVQPPSPPPRASLIAR
jgi:hypothetical protein